MWYNNTITSFTELDYIYVIIKLSMFFIYQSSRFQTASGVHLLPCDAPVLYFEWTAVGRNSAAMATSYIQSSLLQVAYVHL